MNIKMNYISKRNLKSKVMIKIKNDKKAPIRYVKINILINITV